MSLGLLLTVAAVGWLMTALAAATTKVLHEFSRRELAVYCRRRKRSDRFGEILDHYEQVALAAETLQLVATVIAVAAAAAWYFRIAGGVAGITPFQLLAAAAAGSLLLLLAASWFPWAVAEVWASPFLFHSWRLLRIATRLMWPLTLGVKIVDALVRRLTDRPESDEDEEEAFEEEIRSIVTEGVHDGVLEQDASEMIEGVIELGDTDVSDIMTPRSNINALEVELGWRDVLEAVVEAGHTRYPVYQQSLDTIIGVLYVKDLLAELESDQRTPIRQLLRKPWFVPTTKPLDEMLQEFLRTRNHLAVVVDEYRSVAGVVTIEDILEEIVGEIVDESDKDVEDEIQKLGDRVAEVRGIAHVDVVNEHLGLELDEPDEYDTIAGLVIHQLGRIPKPGDRVVVDGARITVLDASRRRVERLRVEVLETPPGE